MKLTAAKVRAASKGRYCDGLNGLILVVWPNGRRNWIQRITINGKRCDLGLGGYPVVTLAQARAAAVVNKRIIRAGGDPRSLPPKSQPTQKTIDRRRTVAALIKRDGRQCQGCGRIFDDDRYLVLDHLRPRSEGGSDDLENCALLCEPCNRRKGNTLTLTGLRMQNLKDGFLVVPLK